MALTLNLQEKLSIACDSPSCYMHASLVSVLVSVRLVAHDRRLRFPDAHHRNHCRRQGPRNQDSST